MEHWIIDINCDVGEGVGNEAELFPHISSCNVACGGHAGDLEIMSEVVRLAKKHEVKVGAHPSYPDKANFGREVMTISNLDLKQSILQQLKDFQDILDREGMVMNHIKAHGALYNETAKNIGLAQLYLNTAKEFGLSVPLYVPFGSVVAKMALEKGLTIKYEAFGDRNYNPDLSLVSRKSANALIEDPEIVLTHVLPIVKNDTVFTVDGKKVKLQAETLCIHGDTPSALQILTYLSQELPKHKVLVQK
ncbi:5-oxoprolinase subunit PxpA [Flagellimonas flava]|uniref:UPF0271 protein n=1 Tax=Flagellimonas flava TaxID=570519 RepID=A0A1M5IFT0_9FLAO|nr:5-oxoprolinase subunit PxpA [Allomuricauda flava]SHG27141.1 UPF0271 protein [Allomuricauda flava]